MARDSLNYKAHVGAALIALLFLTLPASLPESVMAKGQGASGRAPQGGSGRGGVSKPAKTSGNRKSTGASRSTANLSLKQTLKLLKEALLKGGNFTNPYSVDRANSLTPIKFDECTIEFRQSSEFKLYDKEVRLSIYKVNFNIKDIKSIEIFSVTKTNIDFYTFGEDIKLTTERDDLGTSSVGEKMVFEWFIDVRDEQAAKIIVNYLKRAATLCKRK